MVDNFDRDYSNVPLPVTAVNTSTVAWIVASAETTFSFDDIRLANGGIYTHNHYFLLLLINTL